MTKPKTLEQLRAEKERAETQLAQEKHKLNRLENRKKYLEKGERQKRTHRLCNLGGTIESLAPEVKDLTRTEMTELMEYIFSLSEVQRAVRHMAITRAKYFPVERNYQCHYARSESGTGDHVFGQADRAGCISDDGPGENKSNYGFRADRNRETRKPRKESDHYYIANCAYVF